MKKTIILEQEDINDLHDVITDALDIPQDLTNEQVIEVWNKLSEDLRDQAIHWGTDNLDVRDKIYEYLTDNPTEFK